MLTKIGLFVHQAQESALKDAPGLEIFVAGTNPSLHQMMLSLEGAIHSSFIYGLYKDRFVSHHTVNGLQTNPAYLYAKYKTLGLFGIFYIVPALFRNAHNALIEKQKKTIASLLSAILYIPRLFLWVYELTINLLLYFPFKLINALINHEPEYLTQKQQEQTAEMICEHFKRLGPEFNQEAYSVQSNNDVATAIQGFSNQSAISANPQFKHFSNRLSFLSHGIDNGVVNKKAYPFNPALEIITSACASGYCGEAFQEGAIALYRRKKDEPVHISYTLHTA